MSTDTYSYSMRKKDDYRYWLYHHKYENGKLFLDYVNRLVNRNNTRINAMIIFSVSDILPILREYTPEKYSIRITNSEPVFTLSITKELESEDKSVDAIIVRYDEYLPVYLIVSDCEAGDFKNIIARLITRYFPDISTVFITNIEIQRILEKLHKDTGLNIMVESSVCNKRLTGLRKKESQVTYTDLPYSEFFNKVYEQNQWVTTLGYRAELVQRINRSIYHTKKFSGLISRNCFFYIRGTLNLSQTLSSRLRLNTQREGQNFFLLRLKVLCYLNPSLWC